jgi:hypothetical protein
MHKTFILVPKEDNPNGEKVRLCSRMANDCKLLELLQCSYPNQSIFEFEVKHSFKVIQEINNFYKNIVDGDPIVLEDYRMNTKKDARNSVNTNRLNEIINKKKHIFEGVFDLVE